MSLFPQEPKKIRTRIRSYERALRKEQEAFGAIDDSYGKRYLLGPLYLLMGDIEGALQSFAWFQETFPDDGGDPMHLLCWTLALYQSNDPDAATERLRRTMLSNLYLIPHLLGIKQETLDIWHASNLTEQAHIGYIPPEVLALWDEPALEWLRSTYHSAEMQAIRDRYIAIYRQLKTEPRGPRRSELVEEASTLEYGEDSTF